MKTEPYSSAFPDGFKGSQYGLTKLEYFAAMVMQGQLSNVDMRQVDLSIKGNVEALAGSAVVYADALIEALNKRQTP